MVHNNRRGTGNYGRDYLDNNGLIIQGFKQIEKVKNCAVNRLKVG